MANAPRVFAGLFGGGQQQQSGGTQGNEGNEGDDTRTGGGGQQQEETQDDEDVNSLIGSIFGQDESDDDQNNEDNDDQNRNQNNNNQNQNGNDPSDPGTALANEINAAIKGLKVAEDVIPEDFNPADPRQLRDVLGKVQQQGVMTAIQLAMKPMQVAMESQMTAMRELIKTEIQNGIGGFDSQNTLRSLVPEIDDPQLGGMVKAMYETAVKTKKMKPNQAATTVRKAIDAMGLKKNSSNQSGNDPFSGGFKQGSGALDSFLPASQPKR